MEIRELPWPATSEVYRKLAQDVIKAYKSGDSQSLKSLEDHFKSEETLTRDSIRTGIKRRIRKLAKSKWENKNTSFLTRLKNLISVLLGQFKVFNIQDAELLIAREYGFNSFGELVLYIENVKNKTSTISVFELAVDAIVTGDLLTLERLLGENPGLIRSRSKRIHQATLLHYSSANGVEDFRQKTPKNAVEILKFLLRSGADVDAVLADGESTTLGLVATSIHPLEAGLQNQMLEVLLDAGASVNGKPGGWNPLRAALANGRGMSAEFLANRGANLDLEAAAGVGRVDMVENFFNADGSLKRNTTKEQMTSGFAWACEYGRTSVVELLLKKGIDINTYLKHSGQTALHWAAYGAHPDTVKLLLDNNATVNARDKAFDGTPLGWALYGWVESSPEFNCNDYYDVVKLLVAAGATVNPEWLEDPTRELPLVKKIQADSKMLSALNGNLSFN